MKESKVAFVAPGQGISDWSDGVDLVRQWPKAEAVYDTVKKVTGIDIYEVCANAEPVTDPAIAQPAALGIGFARAQFLQEEVVGRPDYLMGLSAGEFTVSAISGALSLQEAAMLSHQRGIYQQAVAGGMGGSVLVIHKRGNGQLKRIADAIEGVHISNFHTPSKTSLSYVHGAYEELQENLNLPAIKRVIDVGNLHFPPHGPPVEKAQEMLAALFERSVKVKNGAIPIVANKTGRLMQSAKTIKKNLIQQTSAPTQLNRGMAHIIDRGVEDFYNLGPGNSMFKLLGDFVALYSIRIHPVKGRF